MMMLPKKFDAETVALMGRVCYDAWWELRSRKAFPSTAAEQNLRNLLALRVMEAVGQGQRDYACLRKIALAGESRTTPIDNVDRGGQRQVKASAMALS
jgi:hypothetical protein